MELAGFGNYPRAEVTLALPRDAAQLAETLKASSSHIARGNGRAYGDAALNPASTISMLRQDRFLAFVESTGHLTCEAGVLLSDIVQTFVPRGWFPLVTPGTRYVTVGGMIASDVHGKNHHHAGAMKNALVRFTLLTADGSTLSCSPTEHAEIFAATCGGMGLTGIITQATIRLQKIETAYIRQTTLRTRNLAETLAAFEAHASATYSVAWIDCLAQGPALGRSAIFLGEHLPKSELNSSQPPLMPPRRRGVNLPCYLPAWALNRFTVEAFNALYYAMQKPGETQIDLLRYFYPLDAIDGWNKMYGKRGFVQYQCVLPKAASEGALHSLLTHISNAGLGSFLAVLKLLGPGHGYLSFPIEGYTLALDFPATRKVFALLETLDEVVAAAGGRVYLTKDARLSPQRLRQFYPELDGFLALRQSLDPKGIFSSLQSQRLGL